LHSCACERNNTTHPAPGGATPPNRNLVKNSFPFPVSARHRECHHDTHSDNKGWLEKANEATCIPPHRFTKSATAPHHHLAPPPPVQASGPLSAAPERGPPNRTAQHPTARRSYRAPLCCLRPPLPPAGLVPFPPFFTTAEPAPSPPSCSLFR
jgi:hypothetical protein